MKNIFILLTAFCFYLNINAQNIGIGTTIPSEKLEVTGAIRLGNTINNNPGTFRYNGNRFEGYNGINWNWMNGFKLPLDTSVTTTANSVFKITNLANTNSSHAISGLVNSPAGIGIIGSNTATSGAPFAIYGEIVSGTGGAGIYGRSLAPIVNGLNSAIYGQNDAGTSGAGLAIGVFGKSVTETGNGVGVHGITSSNAGKGVWGVASAATGISFGVYGQSVSSAGIGVYGFSDGLTGVYGNTNSSSGIGVYATNTAGGKALETYGGIKLTAIGEATGNVLTSDALGNATWQNPATTHNHFGQTWPGSNSFSGLVIQNTSAVGGSTGITVSSQATQGTGVYGVSTGDMGAGVIGLVDHGTPYPPYETNSGLVGVNSNGNGLYATSYTGYAIKAIKLNAGLTVTGPVALLRNDKPTNTAPVLLIQNGASNPTAIELNNGYIKVSGANKMAFVHTTLAGNITSNLSVLNYPNAEATDILFVTHNYSPVNTYFNYNYGVYWNGTSWSIYIETPATPMPVNINFNVMVIKQ